MLSYGPFLRLGLKPQLSAARAKGTPNCHRRRLRPIRLRFLDQVKDVSRHRGSKFRLSARVRADVVGSGNVARLMARQHTDNGATRFRDNLGNRSVVSSAWTSANSMARSPRMHGISNSAFNWLAQVSRTYGAFRSNSTDAVSSEPSEADIDGNRYAGRFDFPIVIGFRSFVFERRPPL